MPQLLFAPAPTDLRPAPQLVIAPENLCDGECYTELVMPDGYTDTQVCLGCMGCAGDDQPPF